MNSILKLKSIFIGLVLLAALPAQASLVTQENGWNYDDYKSTWSSTQNTTVGTLLGETASTFVIWQSFSTTQWMKYILSFSYYANFSGYENVKLRVTVFDGQSQGLNSLFDETLRVSDSMKLLTYDAMFQAMSATSIVRFALSGSEENGSQNNASQTSPQSSLEAEISDVIVEEVSAPATFGILLIGLIGAGFRQTFC